MEQVLSRLTRGRAPRADGVQETNSRQLQDDEDDNDNNTMTQPERMQMQYVNQYTNVIERQLGELAQGPEYSTLPRPYPRPYEASNSSPNQAADPRPLLDYMNAGPPPDTMRTQLFQEFPALPPQDDLDTSKNVSDPVLPSWSEDPFSVFE